MVELVSNSTSLGSTLLRPAPLVAELAKALLKGLLGGLFQSYQSDVFKLTETLSKGSCVGMGEELYFKTTCEKCGGGIEYPATGSGDTVACPHCQVEVFLPYQAPNALGMEGKPPKVINSSSGPMKSFRLYSPSKEERQKTFENWIKETIVVIPVLLCVAIVWGAHKGDPTCQMIVGHTLAVALVVVGLLVYFLPSIVARARNHKNRIAIIALNLLTGWTFVGWVISIVWALKND